MNDEIREILDRIETASEIFDCLLKPEECTELLDYITNLQQENEDLKRKLDRKYYKNEYERIKQEKDNLYLDNTLLKMEKDIYKTGYEELKGLLSSLQNGSDDNEK